MLNNSISGGYLSYVNMPVQMNRAYLTSQDYNKCSGYIPLGRKNMISCKFKNTNDLELKKKILPRVLKVPGN